MIYIGWTVCLIIVGYMTFQVGVLFRESLDLNAKLYETVVACGLALIAAILWVGLFYIAPFSVVIS